MSVDTDSTVRICVTNAKGGTGKTTVAINVAGALAQLGNEVLFVDLDPQGNATEGLGFPAAYDAEPPTILDALTSTADRDAVAGLLREHAELDLLPSNTDLLHAEHELTIADLMARARAAPEVAVEPASLAALSLNVDPGIVDTDTTDDSGGHAVDQLDRVLGRIEAPYDYVLVDTPPFYGRLTDNAMYAAPNLLLPALTEATSKRAVELLFDQVAVLEDETGVRVSDVGVVANRVETTNEDAEMVEWFQTVFPDVPVWEVRKRVALQRAFSNGTSLFEYDDTVDMCGVFLDAARSIEDRFGSEGTR
ncbi:MAG: ATPase involved in chromosome partitioning [halophilic archaeon J07HB67]|jgi:ATPases involved in chromosome partitioning|nr:MAG: ATPase involved in chromosome partitioning [halophilic archaeon J07HB67]